MLPVTAVNEKNLNPEIETVHTSEFEFGEPVGCKRKESQS